ncbi:MAG: hypothetical protein LC102_01315 [Ignavibacteriales bacterium]|nr:MAG: hypothetical protein F9K26_08735 [Ignavibacteriaceae bacterium]MBW7873361.1 hypothetical protein [Ignavibacteria bacterium]MCZ2142051.1 hypothetical protein [Ignavibacteriales bacterium]OQY79266.1 MAG: hypothetical protein B6D45_01090 [Ignavibacteriales bacterium UTCHB3]MBV6444788.1 hypothetical protein [Ignavibacteriaceae bacterium]
MRKLILSLFVAALLIALSGCSKEPETDKKFEFKSTDPVVMMSDSAKSIWWVEMPVWVQNFAENKVDNKFERKILIKVDVLDKNGKPVVDSEGNSISGADGELETERADESQIDAKVDVQFEVQCEPGTEFTLKISATDQIGNKTITKEQKLVIKP